MNPPGPTTGQLALRWFTQTWLTEYHVKPTITTAHASRVSALCRSVEWALAEAALEEFWRDEWVAQSGHTAAMLASSSIWDRCVAKALRGRPWLQPIPDPVTSKPETIKAWVMSLPPACAMELHGRLRNFEIEHGREPDWRKVHPAAVEALAAYRERCESRRSE